MRELDISLMGRTRQILHSSFPRPTDTHHKTTYSLVGHTHVVGRVCTRIVQSMSAQKDE